MKNAEKKASTLCSRSVLSFYYGVRKFFAGYYYYAFFMPQSDRKAVF